MEKEETLRQLKTEIDALSKEARTLITTLDARMHTLYDHRRIIRDIANHLLLLKEKPEEQYKQRVREKMQQLKSEILPTFTELHPEIAKHAEKEIKQLERNELHDIEKLQEDFKLGGTAKEKTDIIIKNLREELKEHKEQESIISHFKNIISMADDLVKQEKLVLQHEIKLIQTTEEALANDKLATEYDSLAFEWRTLYDDLDRTLRTEKREINDHIKPLFEEEWSVKRFVQKITQPFAWIKEKRKLTPQEREQLEKGIKITKEDIARDIARFTEPEETIEYLHELKRHIDLLDLEARKILLQEVNEPQKFAEFLEFSIGPKAHRLWELGTKKAIEASKEEKKELKFHAEKDALTGLLRRPKFEEYLNEVMANKRITRFALLFMDIDNFKIFNDTYGHKTGDSVLAFVSNVIKKQIRLADKACRWGGEEIVVVLVPEEGSAIPFTAKTAVRRAEEIRRSIQYDTIELMQATHSLIAKYPENYGISPEISERIKELADARNISKAQAIISKIHADYPDRFPEKGPNTKQLRPNVTISIGVAVYPEDGEDIAALKAVADRRLYKAKKSGRNTTIAA